MANADRIREKLKDGLTDEVTERELHEITDLVKGLDTQDTREVIDNLSDGDLKKWFDEFHDKPALGDKADLDFDRKERAEAYEMLANRLDGSRLLRVHNNIDGSDNNIDGSERQLEFADAVAKSASRSSQLNYVDRLAEQLDGNPSHEDNHLGSTVAKAWNGDSIGAVRVLEGLDAGGLQSALSRLDNRQLETLVSSAQQRRDSYSWKGPVYATSASPERLVNILETAEGMKDVNAKARLFEVSGSQLDKLDGGPFSGDEARVNVTDAMTGLLKSDVTGVVGALESESVAGTNTRSEELHELGTRSGNGLSTYMQSMLEQGKADTVGEMMLSLQTGNNHQTPVNRFLAEEQGRLNYQNAANLGYYIGAMREGIGAMNQSTARQGELVSNIFRTSISLAGVVSGSSGGFAASILLGSLTHEAVNSVASNITSERQSLADGLETLAWPDINNSTVESAFGDAVDRVVRN
ncbi:MAG: hypothetical protein CSB44_02955 [Gammaproteobacteria bacterium]|nr:MAG: hypothetical protein CSB44_02955 [Gammaproteobacteria bacterium]